MEVFAQPKNNSPFARFQDEANEQTNNFLGIGKNKGFLGLGKKKVTESSANAQREAAVAQAQEEARLQTKALMEKYLPIYNCDQARSNLADIKLKEITANETEKQVLTGVKAQCESYLLMNCSSVAPVQQYTAPAAPFIPAPPTTAASNFSQPPPSAATPVFYPTTAPQPQVLQPKATVVQPVAEPPLGFVEKNKTTLMMVGGGLLGVACIMAILKTKRKPVVPAQ